MSTRHIFGLPDPPTGRVVAGSFLRYVREANGLTAIEVCRLTGMSVSKMSRIESGGLAVSGPEARALLSTYGVTECEEIAGFVEFVSGTEGMAAGSAPEDRYRVFDDHQGWSGRLAALEHRACAACFFSQALIPSFLRIPEYEAACPRLPSAGSLVPHPGTVGADGITVMLETSVLDHPVGGPAVFAAQIEHLLHTANQGLIRVRVVPMDAQVYAPAINIAELVLPNGLRIYATTDGGVLYRGGMDENTRMAEFLQRAADASLPETESRALLEHVRDAAATGKPLLRL